MGESERGKLQGNTFIGGAQVFEFYLLEPTRIKGENLLMLLAGRG